MWEELVGRRPGKAIGDETRVTGEFYQHGYGSLEVVGGDSSRCHVFPCEEGNDQRPSQGFSLSLNSNKKPYTTIGEDEDDFQIFEKTMNFENQEHVLGDGFLRKSENIIHHSQVVVLGGDQFQMIRNSKYLGAVRELLNEFCNLVPNQTETPLHPKMMIKKNPHCRKDDDQTARNSSSKNPSLSHLQLLDLHNRKTKLLSMIEEVDRRYKHYCGQMKSVVSAFEAVVGGGTAKLYTALAAKAMSRHFKCLRDGIVSQITETKKVMGEKETVIPGTTKGETPRLKLVDLSLRQQKVFQQMNMVESHSWKPQRGLPDKSVSILRAWLFEHFLHPYPTDVDKHILARQSGLSRSQVSNWFINARVRLWKPMVEEIYLQETKEQQPLLQNIADVDHGRTNQNHPQTRQPGYQNPASDMHLVEIESECLSSILNNSEKIDGAKSSPPEGFTGRTQVEETFGAVDFGISSFNGGDATGGVSLTLGLQQQQKHGSGSSLFYPRDHIEDCHPVHCYSLLDGGDHSPHNLPYRNLMGAQLLRDLAG